MILVDHAEQAQSVIGIEQAEIVEILDHHHIGSIETRIPVRATFDPVGSTATLVVERFRQNGLEPSRPTALMLLGAVLSDTVILNSPTTTERDHAVVDVPGAGSGRGRPRARPRDVRGHRRCVRGQRRGDRHPRRQAAIRFGGGQTICIAQVEVVGKALLERKDELLEAMRSERERKELAPVRADGHRRARARDRPAGGRRRPGRRPHFGVEASDSTIELPGVMSRKKEVAPKLMTAL